MKLTRLVMIMFMMCGLGLATESSPDSSQNQATVVRTFDLAQNYPNPFNPSTTIRFSLPMSANIKIEIYDLLGNRVKLLVDGRYEAGVHSLTLNAGDLAAGIYFYSMSAGDDYYAMRRMTLLK
ncbi:T9SS type A sorting domain-containing protein [candidate division KSB1 bacterium]|nr:T9SS type A sorting domain-containing protein [candidate division KSB1 bacterium]